MHVNIFIIIGPCFLKNAVEQNKAEKSDGAGMDSKVTPLEGAERGPSEKVTLEELEWTRRG